MYQVPLVVQLKKQDFEVSSGAGIVLGFSFDGSIISAGAGVLTNLNIEVSDFEACLSDVIISSPDAQALEFETGGCVDLPCNDEDGDSVCDNIDDCVGEYDDCGVCNGDNTSCLEKYNITWWLCLH